LRGLLSPGLLTSWLNPRSPSYLIYFVTARCNLACQTCFYWQEIESASPKNELSPEETEKIARTLPRLIQLTISGGEPFLREDLFPLLKPLIEKTRPLFLSIPSNGTLTERIVQTTELLAVHYPWLSLNLELSLDGISELHNQIRGKESAFSDLLKSFEELKKLKKKYKNLRLAILTLLNALNQEKIFELLEYIKAKLNPDRMEVLFIRGLARNPATQNLSIEKFKQVSGWLDKENSQASKNFIDRLRAELAKQKRKLIIETVAQDKMLLPCKAGRKLLVMEPDGKVRACEMLDCIYPHPPAQLGLDNFLLGDLRAENYDLKNILKSDRAKKILKFILQSHCHCSYECAMLANLVFSPSQMIKISLKAV